MNTGRILKYLGCGVLLVVLISFIGSVLGENFREGFPGDPNKKIIETQIAKNNAMSKVYDTLGADITENRDLLTELNRSYMEVIMKGNMIQMITGTGAWEIFKSTGVDGGKAFVGPDAELSYLTVLNEVQAYIDGIKK
jgi:hypothetical protein